MASFVRVSIRNLLRDKTNAFISIAGLAIGMACCILIGVYIRNEMSYNRFNPELSNIYRINWITNDHSGNSTAALTPAPFAVNLQNKIPEIKKITRLYQRSGELESGSSKGKKRFQEQGIYFADPDALGIFSVMMIEGDPNTALVSPNSIVITDEMANKYFGAENPLGQSLLYENKWPMKITGIAKKMPPNSDIRFDFMVSFETVFTVEQPSWAEFIRTDWTFTPCETWIRLQPGTDLQKINQALNRHLREDGNERNQQLNKVTLQPFADIHLRAATVENNESKNDITYIYIFAGVAALILLIANINFINLSIAQSIGKIKEVGLRKVLGADKRDIINGFLGSTLFTGFIAFIPALLLALLALPALNLVTGKQLDWHSLLEWPNPVLFAMLFLITGLLAGLYPAFYITRFNTILALKGRSGDTGKKNRIQKVLLTVQFTVSILLITATGVVYRQHQYLLDKPLGFRKQQMLVVPIFGSGAFSFGRQVDSSVRRRMYIFYDKLGAYPKIEAVTASSEMPGQGFLRGLIVPEGASDKDNLFAPWLSVDYNFISTLKMKMVAGREFSKSTGTDHLGAFIINESAVRSYGWKTPENAIGKSFIRGKLSDGKKGQIIGVVKDFNFNALSTPMEPLVMDVNPPRFTEFAISIKSDHVPETIEYIKRSWEGIFPERVFEYSFLDTDIDAQYRDKENFGRMTAWFAGIAILLSCLGLFSLALFMTVRRAREIGIRKVLGAGVPGIVGLLSFDFLKIVLLASLIAMPAGYWLMQNWLQQFAYHVPTPWVIFLAAPFIALLLTFFTVGFQSIRAAWVSPVKTLHTD